MNLIDDPETSIPLFCVAVAKKAVKDHKAGVKTFPTGKDLCWEIADDWRNNHRKLASTVYRQMRSSLEVTERDMAGSPPGPTERKPT